MDLGAHVSTAGGISKAVGRAQEIGAETIQIFASSPRAWAFKPLAEAKGWEMEDIVMETEVATVSLRPTYEIYLPAFMKGYTGLP